MMNLLETWCKNLMSNKNIVEKVRDLLTDIHSCGVIHGTAKPGQLNLGLKLEEGIV